MVVIAVIPVSAAVAGREAVQRVIDPRPVDHLGLVLLAGVVASSATRWWLHTASGWVAGWGSAALVVHESTPARAVTTAGTTIWPRRIIAVPALCPYLTMRSLESRRFGRMVRPQKLSLRSQGHAC